MMCRNYWIHRTEPHLYSYGALTIDSLTEKGELMLRVPNRLMQKLYVKLLAGNHSPPPPVGEVGIGGYRESNIVWYHDSVRGVSEKAYCFPPCSTITISPRRINSTGCSAVWRSARIPPPCTINISCCNGIFPVSILSETLPTFGVLCITISTAASKLFSNIIVTTISRTSGCIRTTLSVHWNL